MKQLFAMLAAVGLMSTSVMAQASQEECMTNLSIFSEYVKVKNFDAAYEPWKQVYENCPELNYATFSYGERILNYRIDKATGDYVAILDADLQDPPELVLNMYKKALSGLSQVLVG